MRSSFRQGIVRHQTDTLNNPTFLLVSGNYVNLVVSPDPTIIAFVHGTTDYLYTEASSINQAWGPFIPPQDYWLYWDLNRSTGIVTRGFTALSPIESPNPPQSPLLGQMWFNTTTKLWYEFTGAAFVEIVRVFACKLTAGTIPTSLSINAPDFKGTQVGLTQATRIGSLVFGKDARPIRSGDKFFTTEDKFVTGVPTGASLRVNNIIITGQTNTALAAYQIVQYNDFNKIGVANPVFQGKRVFGIVEEDAVANESVNFITEGLVTNEAWNWPALGADVNDPVYVSLTGELTLLPAIPDQIPVGMVIGTKEILFAPRLFPQVSLNVINTGGGGVTAHFALTGLNSDDHPQYLTSGRADTQYRRLTEVGINFQKFTATVDSGPQNGQPGELFTPTAFTIPVAARGPGALPNSEYIQVFLNGVLQERNVQYAITTNGDVQMSGGLNPPAPNINVGDTISIFIL